jgi:hypothetical protein
MIVRVLCRKQPIGHPLLEVPDHMRLASWDRDRQHVALRGPELDNVGAVVLPAIDHDSVLARHGRTSSGNSDS